MLSDKKLNPVKLRKKRPNQPKKPWGDDQKIEAVETFVLLNGNLHHVSAALQIPRQTLQHWMKTEWWKNLYEEVKQQDNLVLSLRLQKIVTRSLDLVEDRLEKGDFFYDQKLGQVVRKEVSLRDAQAILKDGFGIKEAIEKPQVAAIEGSSIADKLGELALQFEKFATKQTEKPKVEVTDVIYISNEENNHPLHEKREEGLQTLNKD